MSGIVESVAGDMIASQINGVLGMLVLLIKDEIILAWGLKEELEELKEQFTILSGLLEGASREPITNPVMSVWLNKIKNVVCDVENLLDEWSYDVLENRINITLHNRKEKLIRRITSPISRLSMAHQVRKLKKMINIIYVEGTRYGINPVEVAAGEVYNGGLSLEILNQQKLLLYKRQCVDDELIGRNEDKTHLVNLICDPTNNNTHLTVVGIVGFPGLGKTALSKRVYTEKEVLDHFNSLVIWLVVSHSFDLIDSLNRMVEILFEQAFNLKDRRTLISKLEKKLKDKKYLLILDDVWEATFWEPLRVTLNEIGGSKGSTVLVTSRNKDVVSRMETYSYDGEGRFSINKPSILQLQGLSEDSSWSLFMARVNDDNLTTEKELIARRVMKYCGGVPLAIRAIGDLLRDQNVDRWGEIEKSELWLKEDVEYGILPSLRLSYNYLPNTALKKCFAYCAIFKEDEVIEKDKLIYMWMAHGFLHPHDELERTGELYCKVLLNSSLFQEAEMDEYGNVKTFKMHDLVMSLARIISMGECLHSNGEYDGSSEVRHLSLPYFNRNLTESCCMKLQTLFYGDKVDDTTVVLLKKCRRLRVLKIEGFLNEISMSKMLDIRFKHLKYLEIHDIHLDKPMMKLPNFVRYHLQTLCITMPNVPCYVDRKPNSLLSFIKGVIMSDLTSLRHFHYPHSIGIPVGLSRLTALQTLPSINLVEIQWGGKISELGLLNNLRGTLELRNVSHIKSEEDASSLFSAGDSLKQIESLILIWGDSEALQQNRVLEAMRPHSNLTRLEIRKYYGTIFPSWLTETGSPLCNLVSLTLEDCHRVKGCLQMENFSRLRYLRIFSCSQLRLSFPEHGFNCCKLLEEIYLNDVYRCLPDLTPLTKLRILHLPEYASSEIAGLGSLPCLRELRTNKLPADLDEHTPLYKSLQILRLDTLIDDTYQGWEWLGNFIALRKFRVRKLKQLPSQQVMQRLSYLHTFHIEACPSYLAEELKSKSGEWFKIAHVPNIIIERDIYFDWNEDFINCHLLTFVKDCD